MASITAEKTEGLLAAPHTPLDHDGKLNLDVVSQQAEYFIAKGLTGVYVAGSTGETASLTTDERNALIARWAEVTRGTSLMVIAHVGQNSLPDTIESANRAALTGADAIACISPNYFKPTSVDALVEFLLLVAQAAGDHPFYYYHIPRLTGVDLPADEVICSLSDRTANVRGLKYTHGDLVQLQKCLRAGDGRFDVLMGFDEILLTGLSLGVKAFIGSSYNLLPALNLSMIRAFNENDLNKARALQWQSVNIIAAFNRYDYGPASKAAMNFVGIDCGPPRLPHRPLTAEQFQSLRDDLEREGFFDWV